MMSKQNNIFISGTMYVQTLSVRNCQKWQRRTVIHAAYPINTQHCIERVMAPFRQIEMENIERHKHLSRTLVYT